MAYHGKIGNANFNSGNLVNLQNWSASVTADTEEATSMGGAWQHHLIGYTDFSVSAEGKSRTGLVTTNLLGVNASLRLSLAADEGAGGPNLEGNAICTEISENVPYDGIATISYQFAGNDAAGLAYTATGGVEVAAANELKAFMGKAATVYIDTDPMTNLRGWTVSLSCSAEEDTVAGAAGKTRMVGVKGGTASVDTLADGDYQLDVGDVNIMKFNRTGTTSDGYYEGTALCTGIEVGLDRSGIGVYTYSFVFVAAVATPFSPEVTLKVA